MKHRIFALLTAVLSFSLCLSVFAPVSAVDSTNTQAYIEEKVVESGVLQSRFLNMLNHNNVYNEAFESVEDIIDGSVISNLSLREENSDYINEEYIRDFAFNMYGVEIEDFSLYNTELLKKEGYVYIIPRGYSVYSHEFVSMRENEDGTYAVTTNVTVSGHDSTAESFTAVSLFAVNENSNFGYNIIYSNICENTITA